MGVLVATGLVVKDRKLFNTTLVASQAYITSGFWVAALKFLTGRERPSFVTERLQAGTGNWHGPLYQYKKNSFGVKPDGAAFSSFPSGHTAAAFSIASSFAEMYRDKLWVSLVSYTSASLVALSRITENKHWASDVFVAGAIGVLTGKQAVRNYKKLSPSDARTKRKKTL
jgi:membrane-associated phospholipid phosphatase